jgi:hypothetical protein
MPVINYILHIRLDSASGGDRGIMVSCRICALGCRCSHLA